MGKSLVLLDAAARLTRGRLPGDLFGGPAAVVVAATEDDYATVIRPRLEAAGADLDLVYKVGYSFDLTKESLARLRTGVMDLTRMRQHTVRLVIFDQLLDFFPAEDDVWNDREVRRRLLPLVNMGRAMAFAVVGVLHTNKGSSRGLNRVANSKAFTAVPRSVLEVASVGGCQELRRMAGNLGPKTPARGFRIEPHQLRAIQVPLVMWIDGQDQMVLSPSPRLDSQPPPIQAKANRPKRESRLDEAKEFLRELLGPGPRWHEEVEAERIRRGISERTLRLAAKAEGIRYPRHGFPARSSWVLPPRDPNQEAGL